MESLPEFIDSSPHARRQSARGVCQIKNQNSKIKKSFPPCKFTITRRSGWPASSSIWSPIVLCNAGGVVVSCFEWVQDFQRFFWDQTEVVDRLFRILENAWTQVLNMSRRQRIPVCLAALSLGRIKRLQQSKRVRGLFP
jgi:hypothetical protein